VLDNGAGQTATYPVTGLGFSISRTVSLPTGGSGDREASAPQLSPLSVAIDLTGSAGLPTLSTSATSGGILPSVQLTISGATPLAQITLTNTMIPSLSTTVGSSVSATVVFAILPSTTIVFDDLAGQSASWAAATARCTAPPNSVVTYALGAAQAGDETISAFSPPVVTRTLTTTSGSADVSSSPPSFSTPSVTIPSFDATVIGDIGNALCGEGTKNEVDLFNADGSGPFLTYAFNNVLVSSFALTGLTSTVSLSYTQVHWTQVSSTGTTTTSGFDLVLDRSL
jgi:type VI protein secretion system component Hcp